MKQSAAFTTIILQPKKWFCDEISLIISKSRLTHGLTFLFKSNNFISSMHAIDFVRQNCENVVGVVNLSGLMKGLDSWTIFIVNFIMVFSYQTKFRTFSFIFLGGFNRLTILYAIRFRLATSLVSVLRRFRHDRFNFPAFTNGFRLVLRILVLKWKNKRKSFTLV